MNKLKIGLGTTVVIIVALAAANAWFYTTQQNQISTLQTDKANLEMHIVMLQREYAAQIANLQGQINTLKTPNLLKINLGETDNRSFLGTPYLHVQCVVVNLGTNTANNCRLHVILYQGSTIAKETDIILGSIAGKNLTSVNQQVFYTGNALSSWSVMPIWTA